MKIASFRRTATQFYISRIHFGAPDRIANAFARKMYESMLNSVAVILNETNSDFGACKLHICEK